MTKRIRSQIQAAESGFLREVAGHSHRDREELLHLEGARNKEVYLNIERSQLRWTSFLNTPWMLLVGGFPGTSHGDKSQGMAQGILGVLCLSVDLGMPQSSPSRGAGVWEEGSL